MSLPDVPSKPLLGLGDPAPLPRRDAQRLERLRLRRSAPAQALRAPGPDPSERALLLEIAARTPDHGKLFPWRFILLNAGPKAELVERLTPFAADQTDPVKARAVLSKLANPPFTVVVVSRVTRDHKVPPWEQELSAGAVCMNLIHAADALGYAASWITDWYAYDPRATALLGIADDERIAGFVHIGSLAEPPLERVRPDLAAITRVWTG